ncbi:MAG: mechanosensitive ion channel domain-containing protein [bacterium]
MPLLSRSAVAAAIGLAFAATVCPEGSLRAQSLIPTASAPEQGAAAKASTKDEPEAESEESPRASLRTFLEAARRGDFSRASRYLEIDAPQDSAALVARRVKLVLDRYVWFDLSEVSPRAAGDTTDALASGVDQIATIRTPDGSAAPVRLRRFMSTSPDSETIWRFSSGTINRIPVLYATLGSRWLVDRLPAALLRTGPLDLLWWQWAAAIPLLFLASLIGVVAGRVTRRIVSAITHRTATELDDEILRRLGAPITTLCTVAAVAALIPLLDLYAPARAGVFQILRIVLGATVFWSIWRLVEVGRQAIMHTHWARAMPASRSLVPLGARLIKVLVAALALVATFSALGYPVASLLAGLGIGGLALALAAQKTVENLFGAFSIGIDQPFREGDFVKVDDFVGTVEAIGLRSTRFRTLDRTIVSLPNGRLADMRLESFTARDRLRLATVIGLVYETTTAQMRAALDGFERVLRAHPKIWPDAVVVRFSELASSSLNIEIMAWFRTSDWSEFQKIRQDVLLQFMDVVEQAGTGFAFPTTTVHLAGAPTAQASTEQ